MPEVISKYPEITLKVLKEAGARCGPEFQPRILIKCPPERFCSLPTGEICVYGLGEIPQMTQVTKTEPIETLSVKEPQLPLPEVNQLADKTSFFWWYLIIAFVLGLALGIFFQSRRRQNKAK